MRQAPTDRSLTHKQRPRTLRGNFSWTFAGNTVYAATQWGMLTVLAKLGSPEMVGQYALALAVTTPVITFANLALRPVQATDARRAYRFGDYYALRLVTTALALLLIGGIVLTAGYHRETALVITVMGLAKGCEAVSDVFYGFLQQHERMHRIAVSMMIKGLLSLVALGAGVYLTGSVLWGTIGLAAVWALILLAYDAPSGALVSRQAPSMPAEPTADVVDSPGALRPRWVPEKLRQLVWLTLPLGFATMLNSLSTLIPRFFVEHYLGRYQLGIFAAMAYLMVAGGTIVNALGQAASPRLARYHATMDPVGFSRLLLKLVGISMLLGLIGIVATRVAGRQILTLLYRAEYAGRADVLHWLMVAAAVTYVASILGYGMTACRSFKAQPFIFAASAAAASLFCALLVPRHGLLGAAWAVTMSALVQTVAVLCCNAHAVYKLHRCSDSSLYKVGAI